MKNKKFGIIVLNWNNFTDTKKCITSILSEKNINSFNLEIFLIDNNSQDGSGDKLKAKFLNSVTFYNTGQNNGYTGGNNFGIKKALENGCDYILVLNNDLYIENFSILIESVYKTFQYDEEIGIIGFEIYNLETKNKINYENKSDKVFNKILNINSKKTKIEKNSFITLQRSVCGCAICFRRKCIEEIGVFDEDFFMYAEEHDISLRAIKSHWKVVKIENQDLKVYRKIDRISENQLIWYYGSRNIFYAYKKNLDGKNYYLFLSLQLFIYFRQIVKYYLSNNKKIAFKILLGIRDFIKNKKGKIDEN